MKDLECGLELIFDSPDPDCSTFLRAQGHSVLVRVGSLQNYFVFVGSSFWTYFMVVSLEGYPAAARAAAGESWLWYLYFVGPLISSNVVLMNLFTGTIREGMVAAAGDDELDGLVIRLVNIFFHVALMNLVSGVICEDNAASSEDEELRCHVFWQVRFKFQLVLTAMLVWLISGTATSSTALQPPQGFLGAWCPLPPMAADAHQQLYWTGFGLLANVVEVYILLTIILHIIVGLKRTWDVKLKLVANSGLSVPFLAITGLFLMTFMTIHLFQFRFGDTGLRARLQADLCSALE